MTPINDNILINLDTGVVEVPLVKNPTQNTLDNVPIERVIYPQGNAQIVVSPGRMAVITAYWNETGSAEEYVDVFKALYSSGVPEHADGNGCCSPSVSVTNSELLRSVKMCGWTLTECCAVLVITIPGRYYVIPSENAVDVIVTAQEHPLQDFSYGLARCPQ